MKARNYQTRNNAKWRFALVQVIVGLTILSIIFAFSHADKKGWENNNKELEERMEFSTQLSTLAKNYVQIGHLQKKKTEEPGLITVHDLKIDSLKSVNSTINTSLNDEKLVEIDPTLLELKKNIIAMASKMEELRGQICDAEEIRELKEDLQNCQGSIKPIIMAAPTTPKCTHKQLIDDTKIGLDTIDQVLLDANAFYENLSIKIKVPAVGHPARLGMKAGEYRRIMTQKYLQVRNDLKKVSTVVTKIKDNL